MTQQQLFDGRDLQTEPDTKGMYRTGQATSKEAAASMVDSGARDSQEDAVLAALASIGFPATVHEIAARCKLVPHQVNRRLSGLNNSGRVRKVSERRCQCHNADWCHGQKRTLTTWEPTT